MSETNCQICLNKNNNKILKAKEMMFGTKDEFDYLECGSCGCLQLLSIPESFADYYPNNYYSFNSNRKNFSGIVNLWIKEKIALFRLGKSILGKFLLPLNKRYIRWLNTKCGIDFESRILDVGCGGGKLLRELSQFGFKNLKGIDPFIDADINYNPNINIYKKELIDMVGTFDLIMLHHSFEHMLNPKAVFESLERLLASNGTILIRIPVSDSLVYETYGVDWVELDAPRHTFLHTKESINILSKEANLDVVDVIYDSSKFEIEGSEKFKKGIASTDKVKLFSKNELKEFDREVERRNKLEIAGRACFYLKKSKSILK